MRMTRLFLTAFIVLIAGAAGQAVPQDATTQDGSQALQPPYYGKKICGFPRPDGVPEEVWENACEACTSMRPMFR